jgi:hypothetical protein
VPHKLDSWQLNLFLARAFKLDNLTRKSGELA